MAKVLPLKGYKALKALNAFHALLLGLKMLPAYVSEDYETFYGRFSEMPDGQKEKMLREAAVFVPLQQDEVEALVSFCEDKNRVPYSKASIDNLNPGELHDVIVSVCMEIGKIKIDLVTESEKKNSPTLA